MGFVPPSGIHSSQLCAQAVKPDEAPENPHVFIAQGNLLIAVSSLLIGYGQLAYCPVQPANCIGQPVHCNTPICSLRSAICLIIAVGNLLAHCNAQNCSSQWSKLFIAICHLLKAMGNLLMAMARLAIRMLAVHTYLTPIISIQRLRRMKVALR